MPSWQADCHRLGASINKINVDKKFKLLYIIFSLVVVANKAVDNFRPQGK